MAVSNAAPTRFSLPPPRGSLPIPQPGYELPLSSARERRQHGIVGMGGNLSPGLLLSAYKQGIFPWFSEDEPILWWSPDPRFVLFTDELHVSATMRKVLRRRKQRALDSTAISPP